MGEVKIKYFAYIGIAIFILSILYFVVSVYTTMVNGELRSQQEFSAFVQQSNANAFSTIEGKLETENYFDNMSVAIENNSYVIAAVLTISNDPVFVYPLSSNVVQVGSDNVPVLNASSPMLKTYSMSLPSQRGQHIVLNAVTYVLRPQDIYNAARISFLIVLAYTLFLILLIVYVSLSKKKTVEYVRSDNVSVKIMKERNTTERETIPVVFRESDSEWTRFSSNEEEKESVETTEVALDTKDDSSESFVASFIDEYIEDDVVEFDYDSENNNDFEEESHAHFSEELVQDGIEDTLTEEITEDSTVSQINDPMGLFSDITGVGWESYMETRLDSELIRSASSEQDLALLFIQIKGIENLKLVKKKIATLLLEYFKYRDFVFEYKDDGFAGILLDVNLDQTMILSEQLYQRLQYLLQNDGIAARIGIGISTRSLRILPGSRIITEASQAVARSFDEEGLPIVAFRVSPEKYRQFVSNSTDD